MVSLVSERAGVRAVLVAPRARRVFLFASCGRLTYGLLPLALLFTVRDATHSFASAGSASAAFAVATLAMPAQARLIDRLGIRRVITPMAALFIALVFACVLALPSDTPAAGYIGFSALLGLSSPALGPATRMFWRRWSNDAPQLKQAAYALDSAAEETLYLIGPALAGIVLALAPPTVLLGACAVTMAIGAGGLAMHGDLPTPETSAATGRRIRGFGALRIPALWPLFAAIGGLAAALGATSIACAGRAADFGDVGWAGVLQMALAAGSVAGALWWSRRLPDQKPASIELARLAPVAAFGLALCALASGVLELTAALMLTGLAIAPSFVVAFAAADRQAGGVQATEAGSWINAVHNMALAGGSSLGGFMVEWRSPATAFALGSAIAAACGFGGWLTSRIRWR